MPMMLYNSAYFVLFVALVIESNWMWLTEITKEHSSISLHLNLDQTNDPEFTPFQFNSLLLMSYINYFIIMNKSCRYKIIAQTKKATQMMLHWIPFAKGSPKEGHCNGTRWRSKI